MTSAQAKKVMPKFHGDDYVAINELGEEDLSDLELDANGMFDMDSDGEDEEEAMRSDLREQQNIARAQMQKDAADELRDFKQNLEDEKEKAMDKARDEARQTRDKHASSKLNHCPDRVEATDKEREDLKREEEKVEAKRAMECEIAENSDEERAANERSDHLNYIAEVRFDQEMKNRKAEKEENELKEEKRRHDAELEEEKRRNDAEEAAFYHNRQQELEILREHEMRKQRREQEQVDAEYVIQQKQIQKRMASKRAATLLNSLNKGTENRRENVEARQGASRRAKLDKLRDCGEEEFQELHDDNLFVAPMRQGLIGESLDSSLDSVFEDDGEEFDSDTPLMDEHASIGLSAESSVGQEYDNTCLDASKYKVL